MADRTPTWLKANYQEYPREDWQSDLIDSISNVADEGTGRTIWVSKKGNNTTGDGTILRPYLTVTQGLGQASSTKPEVVVLPGTYQENVTWPTTSGIRLIGLGKRGAVTIDDASAGGTAVLQVYPATSIASFALNIDNVSIDHNGTGLYLDNCSCQGTFALRLADVDFVDGGGTSLLTNHGTNNPIVVDVRGGSIAGRVYLQVRDVSDAAKFYHTRLGGGMITSGSPALGGTAEITLASSEVLEAGVSGGSANQMFNSLFSWSRTGTTLAKVDTSDLAGNHTENIVGA